MNKLKVYKFIYIYIYMTPSLSTPGAELGALQLVVSEHPGFGSDPPIGSDRIRGATNYPLKITFTEH